MNHELQSILEDMPIIIAVKDDGGLERCLCCDKKVVFVLYGSVISIPSIVRRLKEAGKFVFVDIDLLDGLSAREAAVDYLKQNTAADGIISTKAALVRHAKSIGLLTVHRTFLLDSLALANLNRSVSRNYADFIEILPGLMPKLIAQLSKSLPCPLIASGMIADKEDVITALSAGAAAISSTLPDVWAL